MITEVGSPQKPINPKLAALKPDRKRASSHRPLIVTTTSSNGSTNSGPLSPTKGQPPSPNSPNFPSSLPKITRLGVHSEMGANSAGFPMSPTTASTTIIALGSPQHQGVASPLLGKGRVSMQAAPSRCRNGSSAGSIPSLANMQVTEGFKTQEELRPDLAEYHLERIVQGGQGTVYRGTCPKTGTDVAVKKSNLKDEAPRVNAERERDVFRALKKMIPHPRLMTADVCYIDENADEMVTIMKYLPSDLYTALKTGGKGAVDGPTAYRLTDQLLEATAALHERGFVHRDIKPENIMLTGTDIKKADLVLCDYGLCGIISKSVMLRSSCGSKRYAAPEVWNKEPADTYDGIKVDLWSIGMVFFCLYCGFCPWETAAPTDKVFRVWKKDTTVFYDWAKKFSTNELDPMTKMLFRGLCHPEPKERLAIDDARKLVRNKRFA